MQDTGEMLMGKGRLLRPSGPAYFKQLERGLLLFFGLFSPRLQSRGVTPGNRRGDYRVLNSAGRMESVSMTASRATVRREEGKKINN